MTGMRVGVRGFWIGTLLVFLVVLAVNRGLYVMSDAIAVSVGDVIAQFLIAWLISHFVKWKMKERAPDQRYFILVLASIILALTVVLPRLAKVIA